MSSEWIKIAAPATTSNLGPGFDVFGLALKEPYDIIEGRKIDSGILITEITGPGSEGIPMDSGKNSVGIAAKAVLEMCNASFGIEFRIKKGIRPCSGIGSSGASAAGGAYLANILCGNMLDDHGVTLCAAEAERGTSGDLHVDNVAPCIYGGFVIIRPDSNINSDSFHVISMEPPKGLGVVIAMPDVYVATADSRKVLPREVSMRDMTFHVAHASSLAYAMAKGDIDAIGSSIKDVVIEPARAHLIPHLKDAEDIAMGCGAVASFLGGSGPCVISFFHKEDGIGEDIANKIKEMYKGNGMTCDTWVTECGSGCRRI